MTYQCAIWASLLLLIIHNAEEYFTMSTFYTRPLDIPEFAARLATPVPSNVFLAMLIMVTLLTAVLAWIGTNKRLGSRGIFWGLVLVTSGLFFNSLNHISMSLVVHRYVPGLLSSVTLLLPYSLYFCLKALRDKTTDLPTLFLSLITGIMILAPTILVVKAAATWILS